MVSPARTGVGYELRYKVNSTSTLFRTYVGLPKVSNKPWDGPTDVGGVCRNIQTYY